MSTDRDDRWGDDDRAERFGDNEPSDRAALQRVKPPAILLIITAVLSLLAIAWNMYSYSTGEFNQQLEQQMERQRKQVDQDPKLSAQEKQQAKDVLAGYANGIRSGLPIGMGVLALARIVMFVAGIRLLNGSGRGLGILASLLAMIPCADGCCILGLPVGIWLLVVLNNPAVKAAFRARPTEL